jgi:hypothetical protein
MFKRKKPVGGFANGLFGPIALAGFLERPQADGQIGAMAAFYISWTW